MVVVLWECTQAVGRGFVPVVLCCSLLVGFIVRGHKSFTSSLRKSLNLLRSSCYTSIKSISTLHSQITLKIAWRIVSGNENPEIWFVLCLFYLQLAIEWSVCTLRSTAWQLNVQRLVSGHFITFVELCFISFIGCAQWGWGTIPCCLESCTFAITWNPSLFCCTFLLYKGSSI